MGGRDKCAPAAEISTVRKMLQSSSLMLMAAWRPWLPGTLDPSMNEVHRYIDHHIHALINTLVGYTGPGWAGMAQDQ